MRFWTQEGRLKRHYPLVIITLSTVVAYLISNLRTSLQQNELMWSHIRKLEMQRSSRSPKLDLSSDSVSAAAPPAFRPQSLAPSATARQPIGHPRGGLGWQGEHAATLRAHCGRKRNGAFYMQELIYPKDSYIDVESKNDPAVGNAWRFLLSLNDPQLDQVVSRGILNWLFSIPGTYASATEVHTLCTAVPSGAQRPLMSCTPGKVVVEIGAAIGMVSTYLAQRGMRVYSLDPVLPNVERLAETACINGVRHCLHTAKLAGGAKGRHAGTEASRPVADARAGSAPLERCKNASLWGDFSPANFRPIHALADSVSNKTTTLAALPSNLAATNPAYTSDSTGLSRCLSPSIRFVCARTLRCARSGMRIPSHSYTFWTWSIIREAGSPSWRGSVSSVALDAIVQQDGHGQDIELLHMCPQGSEWAVLQGASRLLQAGRIRHILFGKMLWIRRLFLFLPHLPPPSLSPSFLCSCSHCLKVPFAWKGAILSVFAGLYQSKGTRAQEVQESIKIYSFLKTLGYQFHSVDDCGRKEGTMGRATGPPLALNHQQVHLLPGLLAFKANPLSRVRWSRVCKTMTYNLFTFLRFLCAFQAACHQGC